MKIIFGITGGHILSKNEQATCKVIDLDGLFTPPFRDDDTYRKVIEYAFSRASHFMLVYFYETNKGTTPQMKEMKSQLAPYKVKTRHNSEWPGTKCSFAKNYYHCDVVFYKTVPETKEILLAKETFGGWDYRIHPQDLAFFKGGTCWFYTTMHEKMATCIRASKEDICFFESVGITSKTCVQKVPEHFFRSYDETL